MWKVKIAFVNSYSSSTLLITAFVCLFYIFRFFCALFSAQLHFGTPLARTCFTATSVVWNLNLGCIFKILTSRQKESQADCTRCLYVVCLYIHTHMCACLYMYEVEVWWWKMFDIPKDVHFYGNKKEQSKAGKRS